jgi:DNA-binding transcriptional LysR family regulator
MDRLGRKVILTQAGKLFLDHLERAIRELEQAGQLIQELNGAQRGRLTLGTLAIANSYLIPPLVSQFNQRSRAFSRSLQVFRPFDKMRVHCMVLPISPIDFTHDTSLGAHG